jgi:prolyl-tRNA editing enzyme YbaK/EbsC (Cys-tRNA(Pro) deacylase)
MGIEQVRNYLKQFDRDQDIIEMNISTATVSEAAKALEVIPARIAKSISLRKDETAIIVVTAGDMKLDNSKYKNYFGFKARMLSAEEALQFTGHPVGGVCPLGLPEGIAVYLDVSLQRFQTVFPACGSGNSAIELNLEDLNKYSQNIEWIDVCKNITLEK